MHTRTALRQQVVTQLQLFTARCSVHEAADLTMVARNAKTFL